MLRSWYHTLYGTLLIFCALERSIGKKDPFSHQPSILVENGHLILRSAENCNVSLSTIGEGSIRVNNLDLSRMVQLIDRRPGVQVPTSTHMLRQTINRVHYLEENVTEIAEKVNQFLGSGQETMSNRLRRVTRKVQSLGDQVNTLMQLLTENECNSNPCRNGGTCIDAYGSYICNCPTNWEGPNCESDVNECAVFAGTEFGCQNGARCYNSPGSYRCQCTTNWHGVHCAEQHDDCSTASHQELCGHGACIDEKRVQPGQPKYRCICDAGWQKSPSGPECTVDIDECSGSQRRCSQNPLVDCINLPGTFHCGSCPSGYTGNGHSCADINECEVNNGGCYSLVSCSNTLGSRTCGPCPAGYVGNGIQCSFVGACGINNGCHPLARCIENSAYPGGRECRCPSGYTGSGEGANGCVASQGCTNNPCHHGTCLVAGDTFYCVCSPGYVGILCDQQQDPCFTNPCQNGGTCTRTGTTFTCVCPDDYTGSTCTEQVRSCGGFLSSNNGTLVYPQNDGQLYYHFENCVWVISVESGKVINVSFSHFSVEGASNCEYDFLQVNDGPFATSHAIGHFCRNDLEGRTLTSTHNELYLWFKSDNYVASTGFSLNWTAVHPVCGAILSESEYGSIKSPGYPGKYPRNRDCSWLVQVPLGKRIQFHFATLRMEHHENCSYDYLMVFDGDSYTQPVIGKYCSTNTPSPLQTSGHTATLLFHSDMSYEDTGFHITYSSVPGYGCGGTITTPTGSFSSPNHPNVYQHNLKCEWLIRIHPDNRLQITFTAFNLESHRNCAFDKLEIYDGSSDEAPLLGRFCGDTIPPKLMSNSHQVYVVFISDLSVARSGFNAEYATICGGVYTDNSGVITSPYYPDYYPAHAICLYNINLPQGYLINITFLIMEIEEHGCRYDYLEIHDGETEESPLLNKFCGFSVPENIISTYNHLWIKFVSDGSVSHRGFHATYEAIELGCGGVMTENHGEIASPLHPDVYPHYLNCKWLIKAPPGHIIRLTFSSFFLEEISDCRYDNVSIQDTSGASIGTYCGRVAPPILHSTENIMFVTFATDSSVAREGFRATYEFFDATETCGMDLYQQSGVIRSPGYPSHYPHLAHCVWVLHAQNQRQVILNVTNFHLEWHDKCLYDSLEIRNGGYENSPLVGTYCGSEILRVITSHSNLMRLEFKTDDSQTAPGFEIYFDSTTTGCGGTVTSPQGSIMSPNYPQAYGIMADCEWLIRVSEGSAIVLMIVDIDIEEEATCAYDHLEIFDGNSENSRSLVRICNNRQHPGAIQSSDNTLLIRFKSNTAHGGRGFHISYHTLCNIVLTKRRGVIESPNFPYAYPHNHNCTWTITAPRGNNVSIAFSHIFLESSESCAADYIQILEPRNNELTQITRYCSKPEKIPLPIESTSNSLLVRLITDDSASREGFRLEWSFVGCGGDFRDKSYAYINTPNYPNGYPVDTECIWHVWYPPGSRVQLTILELDLEYADRCYFDYLRVYGGEDDSAPQLLNACHRINNTVITSHGNEMFIHFNSDISFIGRGFHGYVLKLSSGCGGLFTAEESTIMSPNYPSPYNANDYCEWLIQISSMHLVTLDFYDFNLPDSINCTHGYVAVYDGYNSSAPLLLKHCGGKPAQSSISATGNSMLIKLVADGNNVANGFKAHYKSGCGRILNADEKGEITSPNYPQGSSNTYNCSWIIRTSTPGEEVTLIVTHMQLPDYNNCSYTSLSIFDGDMTDSPLIGEHCGTRVPLPIVSRGSILHVFLKGGGIFRATYGVTSAHCGGSFISFQGSFATPGFPNSYPVGTECVWTIEAPVGNKVQMSFQSFNIEEDEHCNTDYVEVRENDESGRYIGRYCGNQLPNVQSESQKLWIKFRSDELGTERGFMANYVLLHGIQLNGTEGEIASPGYPHGHFTSDEIYTWTVTVPVNMFISIRFLDIAINFVRNGASCSSSVMIFSGTDDTAPILGTFCGYERPEPVTSIGNNVFIKYTEEYFYASAWRLHWNAVTESGISGTTPPSTGSTPSCWMEISLNSSEEATINSPNWPEYYDSYLRCTYLIRAPILDHIKLSIIELQLEGREDFCRFDYVEVYTAPNSYGDDWHLNKTLCGRSDPLDLVTSNNLLKLYFTTDGHQNFKGFHMIAKSVCGGEISGTNGVLSSSSFLPYITESHRYLELQCSWVITVKERRTIQLKFNNNFHIPSDSTCTNGYIMLRNGGFATSPLLGNGKYCGSTAPVLPETSSNKVFVHISMGTISQGSPQFELEFTEMSLGCGEQYFLSGNAQYQIKSPNYPSPPPHDMECVWNIFSTASTRIRIDFAEEFRMSQYCYDGDKIEYVQLNDGGTENAEPLRRFCGHDQPSSVMTSGNALYIKYVTQVDNPEGGFMATVQIAECGGTISGYYVTIKSPNYPDNYGSSQECVWILKMVQNYNMVIELVDLDTPPAQNCIETDYIEIRDYDETGEILGLYCGSKQNISNVINVPGNQAYVKFKSNTAVTGKGFMLNMYGDYNAACGPYSQTSPSGVITSPNYPNAVNYRSECHWQISAPEGRRVSLTFNELNLPRDEATGICMSFLRVFNMSYWRLRIQPRSICGNTLPDEIDSSTNSLSVYFHSARLMAGQGFSLRYSTENEAICGGLLEPPSGVISTPEFGLAENSIVECKWKLSHGGENKTVIFTFDVLDIPGLMTNYCRNGSLIISEGSRYLGRLCGNYTSPVVITSPYDIINIRLTAQLDKPFRGVHGTYNISGCGGYVSGVDAVITSPGYPDNYPPNTTCHWIVTVPYGEQIKLTTLDMRLEENCEKDYVLVRKNIYYGFSDSAHLGKFCGTSTPAPITSQNYNLLVIFHSDGYGTAPGFKMVTAEVQRGCGGVIHMHSGNISSPNYPGRYNNNEECVWDIETLPGYLVKLEFTGRFDIEMDNECNKDYLQFEEHDENNWRLIKKICGREAPQTITSTYTKVRITFHTNSDVTADGFNMIYSPGCGGTFIDKEGEIFSPNYPGQYSNLLNCKYIIGNPGHYVTLQFDSFSLEAYDCVYDYVEIFRGNSTSSPSLGKWCGTDAPAARTILGPVMVLFVSDLNYELNGFLLRYEILECGAVFREPYGVIRTPSHLDAFANQMDCNWHIIGQDNKVIALKFNYFDIPAAYGCYYNFLEIREGNSSGKFVGKLCGNDTPPLIKVSGNSLNLRLHVASRANNHKGFSAAFYNTLGPSQNCGGTLTTSTGEITSVNNGGLYEPNLDCFWKIIADTDDGVVKLTFTRFDLEQGDNESCIFDYVEVHENMGRRNALIGRYCGSTIPTPIIASSNKVNIYFHSDDKVNKPGFKLTYSIVMSPCGPSNLIATNNTTVLSSPNYPNPYPINLRCRWNIYVNASGSGTVYDSFATIDISFSDIDIPCDGDYIEIQRLRSGSNPSRLCGPSYPHSVIAGRGLAITLHSDSVVENSRGFSLTYKIGECNRTYTKESGSISSPSFPYMQNFYSTCSITITAPAGRTISLHFVRFILATRLTNTCEAASLEVYDGINRSTPLLAKLCGYRIPDPIFSTGHVLHLYFNSEVSYYGLFQISYVTTSSDRGCGGDFNIEKGAFSSPLFPQAFNKSAECTWTVTVAGYHSVKLTFQTFSFNSSSGCETNYVEIYEGNVENMERRVSRLCGNDRPAPHTSQGNQVLVKMVTSETNTFPGFYLLFDTVSLSFRENPDIIQSSEGEVNSFDTLDFIY